LSPKRRPGSLLISAVVFGWLQVVQITPHSVTRVRKNRACKTASFRHGLLIGRFFRSSGFFAR
jgi:hypothetical protein